MYRKYKKEEFYTKKAREEGYPARSVYKLKEIDEKFRLIKKGDRVLDLGSAPGSWLIYISEKIGKQGVVLGTDIEDIKIKAKENIIFIKKDISQKDFFDREELLKRKYDVIVSDLSPKTTGIKSLDAAKSLELSELAFEIAKKVLKPGGNFTCKIFENQGLEGFFKKTSSLFKIARRFRPKAVWQESREIYIIGLGFSPGA